GRWIVTLGGRSTAGRLKGSRDHPASLAPRSDVDDPAVLAGSDRGRGSPTDGVDRTEDAPLLRGVRQGPAQPDRFGRRGKWEDDVPWDLVGVHTGLRAPHHYRGRSGTASGQAARHLPRGS